MLLCPIFDIYYRKKKVNDIINVIIYVWFYVWYKIYFAFLISIDEFVNVVCFYFFTIWSIFKFGYGLLVIKSNVLGPVGFSYWFMEFKKYLCQFFNIYYKSLWKHSAASLINKSTVSSVANSRKKSIHCATSSQRTNSI